MPNIDIIIEPLIGTIIGFGTNYIAIKMLFRPYKPIKIGKFTLPFTPGVIPKRKEKLAQALGNAISNQLFTSEDIKNIFLSEKVKNQVIDNVIKLILSEDLTIKELLLNNISEEKYIDLKKKIEFYIAQKIIDGLISMNIGDVIVKEGSIAIKEKLKNSFFGKFISDDLIMSITIPTGKKVDDYIKENGEEKILPYIDKELNNFTEKTISSITSNISLTEDKLKEKIEIIYTKIIEEKLKTVFDSLNISEVIINKINEMDIKELEKLFMSIMKKELNAIVNLGAVLGFLLGIINIFI